ncbi:hypothetical protein MSAN_01197100 [Mycena sanguinolenta]|uniref:Glycan binding protein Y3-like domain-containing protein n=1 Tax=Mycena sanguinolenta TaxID=230812 RepID=A0A8H7D4F4_9AGAR|nr:hypothetical protein MSAN_01196700 [Mycena sanguinolenta]KAF7358586.1 hypothetical protein MSAN_01197100 [Mycena sanguinolenta]
MLSASRKWFAMVALSLLVLPCLATVEVSCSDGFQEDCASFVKTFCQGIATDLIAPSDTASRCFAAKNGASCGLAAKNLGNGEAFPTVEDCETAFAAVSALCPQGGSALFQQTPMTYQVLSDTGSCGPPVNN